MRFTRRILPYPSDNCAFHSKLHLGSTDPLQNHLNKEAFRSKYDSTISKLAIHIQEHFIIASMKDTCDIPERVRDFGNFKRNGHINLVKWARQLSPSIT